MLSIAQWQVTTVSLHDIAANQAQVAFDESVAGNGVAAEQSATPAPSSTTVSLSATGLALAVATRTGALQHAALEQSLVSGATEGLRSHDPDQKPNAKSKLQKMLRKTTLLELLDRWSMQRDVEKKGGRENAEAIKQQLKNREQLQDLV